MSVYFTSDTHFDSKHTLIKDRRPFKDVKEMNDTIVKNWNSIVKENDTVYHLGDFGNFEYCKKLNGNIIFIVGNHELRYYGDKEIKDKFKYLSSRYGFKEVCYNKYVTFNGQKYFLTHKPSSFSRNSNCKTLFGHMHRIQLMKDFGINVGQDCHYFRPISLEDVEYFLKLYEDKHCRDIDYLV